MKTAPALAIVEFDDIAAGVFATDAMLKKAPIAFVRSGTITRGRYLTLIAGSTASVEVSLAEGLASAGRSVVDHLLLADVHPRVFAAMCGARLPDGSGALAVIETDTVAAVVRAAELALKGTPVELVEIRLADAGLAGKGLSVYRGDLHDVEAAVAIVERAVRQGGGAVRHRILPSPHDATARQMASGTSFAQAEWLDLGGEAG